MGLNFPHQHRRQSSGDPATHPVSCIHLQNCFVDVYSDRAFGSELCSLLERDAATLLFFFSGARVESLPDQLQRSAAEGRFQSVGEEFSSMVSESTPWLSQQSWNCSGIKIVTS